MAKKTMPQKAAAKKSSASSKKPLPAVKTKFSPPSTAAKPVRKPVPKPATRSVSKPASKPLPKPAAKTKPAAPATLEPPPPPAPVILPPPPSSPVALASLPKTVPLTVNVQTSQGMAANGNTQPANLLVIITCAGWPVTELDKNHFTLMEHFEVPGQMASFSNSITTFRNAGTGAYLLQTRPINGTPWRSGHHLGQLLVSNSEDQQGQAAFKIIIR